MYASPYSAMKPQPTRSAGPPPGGAQACGVLLLAVDPHSRRAHPVIRGLPASTPGNARSSRPGFYAPEVSTPVLATKLFAPARRPRLVARRRLAEQLDSTLELDDLPSAEEHLETARVLGEHASISKNRHRWSVAMAQLCTAAGDYDTATSIGTASILTYAPSPR
jgi:hypothetical protein